MATGDEAKKIIAKAVEELIDFGCDSDAFATAVLARLAAHNPPILLAYEHELKE
jgi:hypothetical protein